MRLLIVALIIVFMALQFRLWFGDGSLSEVVKLSRELELQKQKLKQLEEKNRKLEAQVLDLQNGFDAYEEKARNDLGMIKKDETFFQIVTPQQSATKP